MFRFSLSIYYIYMCIFCLLLLPLNDERNWCIYTEQMNSMYDGTHSNVRFTYTKIEILKYKILCRLHVLSANGGKFNDESNSVGDNNTIC